MQGQTKVGVERNRERGDRISFGDIPNRDIYSKLGHHPLNLCWSSALPKAVPDPKLGMLHIK